MPRKSTDVMKLKANAGEAGWYATPEGRRRTQREFARALKEGTLIRSAGSKIAKSDLKLLVQLMEQARRKATRSISIRVPNRRPRTGAGDRREGRCRLSNRAQASHQRRSEAGRLIQEISMPGRHKARPF
jgi:hypothetical protein